MQVRSEASRGKDMKRKKLQMEQLSNTAFKERKRITTCHPADETSKVI